MMLLADRHDVISHLLSGERDQTPDDQRNEGDEEPAGDSRLHDIFRDLVRISSM